MVKTDLIERAASVAWESAIRLAANEGAAQESSEISWPDSRLVRECLDGNERAWSALIDKYKNLIYSVPVKWGFAQPDASDIFQSVVADLLSELSKLRDPAALPAWLVQVTRHKCIRWRRHQMREAAPANQEPGTEPVVAVETTPESLLEESMREQMLRNALHGASDQCRSLIRMLFYETPTRPYAEVAEELGIAIGSIGFTRRKCLDRLRRHLEKTGFVSA